jgi:hypothetical protein
MDRWRRLAFAVFLLAWFLYFTHDDLGVHFALDEIGNMAHYYRGGPFALALSQFTIWHGDYRPMGGLFYVPLVVLAGLNPVPYQVALLAILLVNVGLVYLLAARLGAGEVAAGMAALVVAYHAGLHNLYYNGAFVYDALCCLFYIAALLVYLRGRERSSALWIALVLVLDLCAMNSKEMVVTLPPVNVFGKVFGPEALVNAEACHPGFSLRRIRDFQRLSLGDLLFGWAESCCSGALWLTWRGRAIVRYCASRGSGWC